MIGYAFLTTECGCCGRLFTCHPRYVPSSNNVAFCEGCMRWANEIRAEKGLAPHPIHPRAYDIAEEGEV